MIVAVDRCIWILAANTGRRKILFPTYFHSAEAHGGLYTLLKSEYSTAAVELRATEGVSAILVEDKLHNDRTRNGTRGISSDGIQRHKVRAVE